MVNDSIDFSKITEEELIKRRLAGIQAAELIDKRISCKTLRDATPAESWTEFLSLWKFYWTGLEARSESPWNNDYQEIAQTVDLLKKLQKADEKIKKKKLA